ncbi:unknown [Bacillus thuringiensis phage MZTP02]|uniref:Uncharacterized protein n=1 Tax=Bacillus thuringiensis phage MZTP02 TaxID=311221 RepID=Q56AS5_9CAUD|nr:unknown [Bacillus thuringiensis phage MZTP02]
MISFILIGNISLFNSCFCSHFVTTPFFDKYKQVCYKTQQQ